MKINGLRLPKLMIELLESDYWQRELTREDLKNAFDLEPLDNVDFLSLESMERETNAVINCSNDPDFSRFHALASSKKMLNSIIEPDILDLDASVIFAGNYADEVMALDYRSNFLEPRVLLSVYPPNPGQDRVRWLEISASFEDFVRCLNLIQSQLYN